MYIPMGGNRVGMVHWIFNIFVVWGFTGLWHGAEWNFILWGLFFGVLLIIEKLWLLKVLEKEKTGLVRHIYVEGSHDAHGDNILYPTLLNSKPFCHSATS